MKITIYELLGMVKDGKIPKKIKYDNDIWEYIEEKENYKKSDGASLNWDYVALYCLKEPVEILEEEKKIPEKLGYFDLTKDKNEKDENGNNLELHYKGVADAFEDVYTKIDEIIDCLDYLKSKGDK